jgi:hypothetical protein
VSDSKKQASPKESTFIIKNDLSQPSVEIQIEENAVKSQSNSIQKANISQFQLNTTSVAEQPKAKTESLFGFQKDDKPQTQGPTFPSSTGLFPQNASSNIFGVFEDKKDVNKKGSFGSLLAKSNYPSTTTNTNISGQTEQKNMFSGGFAFGATSFGAPSNPSVNKPAVQDSGLIFGGGMFNTNPLSAYTSNGNVIFLFRTLDWI